MDDNHLRDNLVQNPVGGILHLLIYKNPYKRFVMKKKKKMIMKNKVQHLKKERRNLKKKERELKRRQDFQYYQYQKSEKKLWSIPQPEEHTFDGRGYKKLFHFTTENHLPPILKSGVIFGDVVTGQLKGFNTPNLTTENEYHNPSSKSEGILDQNNFYRLTINCPKDKEKLINYGWFDKTYCKGVNHNLTEQDPSKYGNMGKQYIYLGHITTSMIEEVKVWNSKTEYWDVPKKKEIDDLCFEYDNLTYSYKFHHLPSQLRTSGLVFDDYTGKVIQFQKENDHKELYKDFYMLTDYICKTLKGKRLTNYRRWVIDYVQKSQKENSNFTIEDLIKGVVETYNSIVDENDKLDQNEYLTKMRYNFQRFDEWVESL